MMFLYSLAVTAVLLASAPVWGWRMARQGRYREGLRERLGAVPARLAAFVRDRPAVWLHAVSVGETQAATRLVADLKTALPGYAVAVSTTTPAGQRVARERFGVDSVFFYPLDYAFAVRAYLRVLRPRLVILMESEVWPRMIAECARAGVPVAVVNARVSDRSLPRSMALRGVWRPVLRRITLLLAQSEEDARRWTAIGVPAERVLTTGNLKFDVEAARETPLAALVRKHLPGDAKVLVCGSTHDGEETLLLDCWRAPGVSSNIMVLAPRRPERAGEVDGLARSRGLPVRRLSRWRLAPEEIAAGTIVLVDTVGELASLYSLATAAFVGGSLVPHGGQNPLEAARFGVPVIMGGSYENFREVVNGLARVKVLTFVSAATLCATVRACLQGVGDSAVAAAATSFFEEQRGATGRTVAALVLLLNETLP